MSAYCTEQSAEVAGGIGRDATWMPSIKIQQRPEQQETRNRNKIETGTETKTNGKQHNLPISYYHLIIHFSTQYLSIPSSSLSLVVVPPRTAYAYIDSAQKGRSRIQL